MQWNAAALGAPGLCFAALLVVTDPASSQEIDRTTLPVREPDYPATTNTTTSASSGRDEPGMGGACELYVDDVKVAEGRIPRTQPYLFSADEGADVGMDGETAVSKDYVQGANRFTGKIVKVTVAVKAPK
jgi:hypothetical protein